MANLGFLGADKQHENIVLPFKNSKKKEITDLQKQINKGISNYLETNNYTSVNSLVGDLAKQQ